jgi:hypothetical protein
VLFFCHAEALFSSQRDQITDETLWWECEVCGEAGICKHPLGFAQIFVLLCSLQWRNSGLLPLQLSRCIFVGIPIQLFKWLADDS